MLTYCSLTTSRPSWSKLKLTPAGVSPSPSRPYTTALFSPKAFAWFLHQIPSTNLHLVPGC